MMIIQPINIHPQPISALLVHALQIGKRIWLSQFPVLFLVASLLYWSQQGLADWALSQGWHSSFVPLITAPVSVFFTNLYLVYVAIVLKRSDSGIHWDQQLQAVSATAVLLPTVILASLLSFAAIFLGTILLIIPGLLLLLWFTVFPQIAAFERIGAMASLKRSLFLVKGSSLRVAGLLLAFIAIRLVLQLVPELLFPTAASQPGLAFSLFIISEMLILPFEGAAYYLLYLELRARKEAFDYEVYREEAKAG